MGLIQGPNSWSLGTGHLHHCCAFWVPSLVLVPLVLGADMLGGLLRGAPPLIMLFFTDLMLGLGLSVWLAKSLSSRAKPKLKSS